MLVEPRKLTLAEMAREAGDALATCDVSSLETIAERCKERFYSADASLQFEVSDSQPTLTANLQMLSRLLMHTDGTLKVLRMTRIAQNRPLEYQPIAVHGA